MQWIARFYGFLLGCLRCIGGCIATLKPRQAASTIQYRARHPQSGHGGASRPVRFRPKPPWVLREVIRLKALMPPDTGCRAIAAQFNRLHGGKKNGETVGRTWVAENLKKHRYKVLQLRRRLKHTKPRPMPAHRVWAMDMTGLPDKRRQSRTVVGIIDHGSRWLLDLKKLQTKTSIALLRALLDAIETHDFHKPERLRTDNEAVFSSRLFRFGL